MTKTMMFGGLLTAAVLVAAPIGAQELRYDNGLPESHVVNVGFRHFMEALAQKSDGRITVQPFYSSLQTLVEASAGLRDGILDMGGAAPQYVPSEFPVNSFVSQLPAVAKTAVALTGADTEFVLVHCEPCRQEFFNYNHVPLSMYSNPPNQLALGSKAKPVTEPSDLAGLRLRSGGDYFRDWIEFFGGTAVSIPGPETFDAFSSGIVDGTVTSITDVAGYKLEELVSSITIVNVSPWHSATFFDMRRDLWQGMAEEDRLMMIDLVIDSTVYTAIAVDAESRRVLDDMASRVSIHEASAEFNAAHETFIAQQLEKVAAEARDKRGIADAEALAQTYFDLTIKWQKLAEGIDTTDAQQVRDLYAAEIYDKIDRAGYGM